MYKALPGQEIITIDNQKVLLFGSKGCPFSNFLMKSFQSECPWDGEWREMRSGEHAFQAFKAENKQEGMKVLEAKGPVAAKQLGRGVAMREDWDKPLGKIGEETVLTKIQVMFEISQSKYAIPQLGELLASTEDLILIERAPWDAVWGAGKTGKGTNWLGRTLMTVRNYNVNGELSVPEQTPFVPVN